MKKWIASLIFMAAITAVVYAAKGLNPVLDCYENCNAAEQIANAECTANGRGQDCYDAATAAWQICEQGCKGVE